MFLYKNMLVCSTLHGFWMLHNYNLYGAVPGNPGMGFLWRKKSSPSDTEMYARVFFARLVVGVGKCLFCCIAVLMHLKQKFLMLCISRFNLLSFSCKFGQLGPGKCQFNSPHGFCLGMEQDIIVADTNNHRIQVFEKSGEFKTQFGIPGK